MLMCCWEDVKRPTLCTDGHLVCSTADLGTLIRCYLSTVEETWWVDSIQESYGHQPIKVAFAQFGSAHTTSEDAVARRH